MPDEPSDEQQFSDYLADLLEHHAGQVSDVPMQPGSGTDIARAPSNEMSNIVTQFLQQHFQPVGPGVGMRKPFPGEQRGVSDLEAIGEAATFPDLGQRAVGGGLNLVAQKIMDYARKNPRKIASLLGSLGLLGSTTQTSRATGPAPNPAILDPATADPSTPEGYAKIEEALEKEIKGLQAKIDAAKQSSYKTTGGGYNRRTQERTYGTREFDKEGYKTKTEDDQKHLDVLQQRLDEMKEEEKPYLEKHPGFPGQMVGLGGAVGLVMGYRAIEAARAGKKALNWFQKAGGPGLLVGIPEAAMAFGVPEGEDIRGVGRAKKAAQSETWDQILKRLGIETAEAGGASGVGYKIGSLTLPSPVISKGGGNLNAAAPDIQQILDLNRTFRPAPRPAAPAAAAPPVAVPPAAKTPNPQWSIKRQQWYNAAEPGNPTLKGWENVPPPGATAATPKPKARRTVPTETVVPSEGAQSLPTLLRNLGTKPGPEGGFMGGPEK